MKCRMARVRLNGRCDATFSGGMTEHRHSKTSVCIHLRPRPAVGSSQQAAMWASGQDGVLDGKKRTMEGGESTARSFRRVTHRAARGSDRRRQPTAVAPARHTYGPPVSCRPAAGLLGAGLGRVRRRGLSQRRPSLPPARRPHTAAEQTERVHICNRAS